MYLFHDTGLEEEEAAFVKRVRNMKSVGVSQL